MGFTAAMVALSAAAGAANAGINASRSPQEDKFKQALELQQLTDSRANQHNQALVQALINQRSTAGQQDAFGSGIRYDPTTNQWISTTGALPKAAETAAMQASVARNTTDMRQAQLANEQAALRASRNAPMADAAARNLASFRPMQGNELSGLLEQKATNASNATFRPMIQDTLREFARTGTSAGPVLGQLGRDASANLRDSLIDAQLKGMTGTDQINQSRRSNLSQAASDTAGLANPNFQYTNISPSGVDNTMAQVLAQRANTSAVAPAYGMSGANTAQETANKAAGTAAGSLSDPNYGLNAIGGALGDVKNMTKPGGDVSNAYKSISDFFGSSTSSAGQPGYNPNPVWNDPNMAQKTPSVYNW